MGGEIGVESNTPSGALFWFTFDTIEISPAADALSIEKNELLPTSGHVLLVDDNNVNLQIAAEILKKSGCKVTTANSGKNAINAAKKERFDLIFMDIQMPDMDGVESAKRIKAEEKNKNTPVIAMTAYSMKGDREKYLSSGMDDYISKPIAPESLVYTVKKWIDNDATISSVDKNQELVKTKEILNYNVLGQLEKFGGREIVVESLEEFKNECDAQIKDLEALFEEQKFDDILIILHTIKGNAGTLGVQKIAFWAEFMEDEMKKKNYHIFESNMKEFIKLYSEFKEVFKQY